MKKFLLLASAFAFAVSAAHAASYTTPSYTLTGPLSTGSVCTPTAAASGPASAVVVGTILFTCVVSPSNWVGVAVSPPTNVPLSVVNFSGINFSLAATAAGVIGTEPVGTGGTTLP